MRCGEVVDGGPPLTAYQRAVAEVVASLAPGELLSYGEAAREAGYPGAARGVAGVLHRVPDLPWWRVVSASGRLTSPSAARQRRLLEAEGVRFDASGRLLAGTSRAVPTNTTRDVP